MRPADRQLASVWAMLAVLGLCVMAGFLLIYHLFGVEHADRRAQQAQTAAELAAQHASLCGFAAAIPLPAEDTPYLQELERRARCPRTVPTPLLTATRTVTIPGPDASRAPVGAAEPHAQPTVIITAPTGPAPTRPAPSATPTPTPSPTTPPGLCVLTLCIRSGP